jgi:branched-chain amino acid transport system permease protein
MNGDRRLQLTLLLLTLILLGVLTVAPLLSSQYTITVLYQFFIFLTLAASYDVAGGYMGYMNLGHCCFFGVAGYAFTILADRGFSFFLCAAGGVAASMAFAALVAIPFFRLRGAYFALGNLGLIMLMEMVATNLSSLTGGDDGMTVMISFSPHVIYFVCMAIAIATIVASYFIGKSRFGLALVSIREDEEVARSFGIKTLKVKITAFLLGALPAALVGILYAISLTFINPTALFGVEMALMPATMAMFGGTGLIVGPVLGTVVIYAIQEILWTKLPYLHLAIYGGVLIFIGLYMPGGIARLPRIYRFFERLGLGSRIYRAPKFDPLANNPIRPSLTQSGETR